MPKGVYKRTHKISHSPETREKMRKSRTGARASEITKLRISRYPHVKGEWHGMAVLNEDQVLEIRRLYSQGVRQKDLAEQYNVVKGTIWHIVVRRTWKHI